MKVKDILDKLEIDETDTKPIRKPKTYTKVKDITNPLPDMNFMADLLMLPITPEKYRYLLVVVDLGSDECDFEPLKTKKPEEVLKAFKTIIKRKYLKLPEGSIRTDGGAEFKGVFQKYLYNKSVLMRISKKGRHTQMANVERLNRTLGRILNGYMNKIEKATNKKFTDWVKPLDEIRVMLNQMRKKDTKKIEPKEYTKLTGKFKVGDLVNYALDVPEDELGNELHGKFRVGDRRFSKQIRKVRRVLNVQGAEPIRYILTYMPNVSFTEKQLRFAYPSLSLGESDNDKQETFDIKKLLKISGRGKNKKVLVWWKGYLKKDATLEPYDYIKKVAPDEVKELEKKK